MFFVRFVDVSFGAGQIVAADERGFANRELLLNREIREPPSAAFGRNQKWTHTKTPRHEEE